MANLRHMWKILNLDKNNIYRALFDIQRNVSYVPAEHYLNYRPAVILAHGTGRAGKSHLARWLIDIKTDIQLYTVDFKFKSENRESTKIAFDDIFELENCDIFIDDVAQYLNSRNYADDRNKAFMEFVPIISHKDIRIIATVQNLSILDISAFRTQEILILQKYSDLINIEFERKEMYDIIKYANKKLQEIANIEDYNIKDLYFNHKTNRVFYYNYRLLTDDESKPHRHFNVLEKLSENSKSNRK